MPPVPPDEVHVWSITLDRPEAELPALRDLLSVEERARADRFVSPTVGRRFTVGRAAVRTILARYLDADPRSLAFRYGPRGRPRLEGSGRVDFNLTHSHELAVCAVTDGRPVGVDLERLRPMPDLLAVALVAFSPREQASLLALPEAERLAGFFRCWTGKEAYVKARGDGLALPLDGFDLAFPADRPPALLTSRLDPDEPARWTFYALAPADGYVGALAVAWAAGRGAVGDLVGAGALTAPAGARRSRSR